MNFNTEMVITLPSEREEDYYSNVAYNVGKFLGKVSKKYLESVEISYLPSDRHNMVSFTWPKSILSSDVEGEEALKEASKKVDYWFRHCKFFRKHGVSRFSTSYEDEVEV